MPTDTRSLSRPVAAMLLAWSLSGAVLADYPFPTSLDEKQAAKRVLAAVRAGDEDGVKALVGLLATENPRVQAAALVGLLRLSDGELDFGAAVAREVLRIVQEEKLIERSREIAVSLMSGLERVRTRTGRIKEIIIKGGENIAPKEVDEAFYKHPAILDAAAVGIPNEHYGEEIMCCCFLKPDCTCTEEELREHCKEHLGEFKTPKVIKIMDELPKGPSGKIQRLKLPEFVKRLGKS